MIHSPRAQLLGAHEAAHGQRPQRRFLLVGADEHDRVELPKAVFNVLCPATIAARIARPDPPVMSVA